MVLSRATNRPGPDGVLGTNDDVQERRTRPRRSSTRTRPTPRTPRTRSSCASTSWTARRAPADTGRLLTGAGDDGLATWADLKTAGPRPARHRADRHRRAQRPPAGDRPVRQLHARPERLPADRHRDAAWSRAAPAARRCRPTPGGPATRSAVDIAHHAVPVGDIDPSDGPDQIVPLAPTPTPARPMTATGPRTTTRCSTRTSSPVTAAVNENIGLTAVHHVFHSEHNRLVGRDRRPDHDTT